MIGRSLGHYEILASLGAGGMGDVYRARDTRLGRDVAIKVLPEELAADAERLVRFEREARVLASLNHPHIAQIHGLEEDEGRRFLVLELVAGESLAERLARGPIPVRDALPIALQVAKALEAAHARGIVHRDVKPANVMLTPEGDAKVLDFGIAKPLERPPRDGQTRTLTGPPTRPGVAMGTPAYMSPEQLRGEGADRRSDIWAFGVTLWEMLTGMRLFAGATDSDTVAAVLQAEPHWHALPANTPRAISRVLRHCLERDPRRRLHDIADARLEIEEALAAPAEVSGEGSERPAGRRGFQRWIQLLAALVVGAALALGVFLTLSRDRPAAPAVPRRLVVNLPKDVTIHTGDGSALAISPDGQWLVFEAKEGGSSRLFKRSLDQFDIVAIPGTDGARHPFFSPDGRWVGFFADGMLKKVLLAGGPAQLLADAPNPWGGTWGPDGTIVFCRKETQGLWRVPYTGGTPELVIEPDLDQPEWDFNWPEFLPGGGAVLFTSWSGLTADSANVCVVDLASRTSTILVESASYARYVSSGHLIFEHRGAMYVAAFDAERREITGLPVPVPEPIFLDALVGLPHLAVSTGGTLAFIPGGSSPRRRLVSVDLAGQETPLIDSRRAYMFPRYSPDGDRLAVTISEPGDTNVWIIDLTTGTQTKLTLEGSNDLPLWSPDGERVSYLSDRVGGGFNIDWKRADGCGESEVLIQGEPGEWLDPGVWSPDGETLIYSRSGGNLFREKRGGIWIAARDGAREPRPFAATGSGEFGPAISPDGRWLAYGSFESGRSEVFVQRFPEGGERHQISAEGGQKPVWSPDGGTIYYRDDGDRIMAVPVATSPRFRAAAPQVFVDGDYELGPWAWVPNFDVAPDSRSLVMVKPDEDWGRATEIRVVLNWFDELRRLAPPDRTP